jgi:serine/threonine-protein kinase RsbW
MGVHRRSFPACADSVPDVRHAAVAWAQRHGLPTDLRQTIALAVTEAAANVVVHAYRDRDEPGNVDLELALDGEGLVIRVVDQGLGMAPRADSPGLGLGMPLIATLADSVEVRSLDVGGTEVCMRFGVAAEACVG